MATRRRFRHRIPLKDRLTIFAKKTREKAALLPPGYERQDLLEKARQADHTAAHLDDWIVLAGLATARVRPGLGKQIRAGLVKRV
jgi:hypothetical protein